MEIVNIRIDERLIHGQVAAMWTGNLKANRIIVVDNEIITDQFRKKMLKMACPSGVKLSILDVKTAAQNIQNLKYQGERLFVIVKGPEVLEDMFKQGFPLKEVNVANMAGGFGTRQVKKTICITNEDESCFYRLHQKGVHLVTQMVPSESKEEFIPLLDKLKEK